MPPTPDRLLRLALHLGPEASVILAILALEQADGVARVVLRDLVDRTRFTAEPIVAALLDLDRRNVLAVSPRPTAERLDASHEIMALHSPETAGFTAVSSIVRRNVDVNSQRELQERNGGSWGQRVENLPAPEAARALEGPAAWAEAAAETLGDRKNIACYHAFVRRYPRPLLERALAIAASCPEERIRKSRGAYFVALVKRFAEADGGESPAEVQPKT
jgi:hypothetical protein